MASEIERFRRLFEYEVWCTPRLLDSLKRADAAVKETGLAALVPPLDRAIEIFCHVQGAKQVWLSRASSLVEFPRDGVFPVWDIERAAREAADADRLWTTFMSGLDEAAIDRIVHYTSTEGVAYASTLADILTHVVNHGSYHRGQIALLVAQTGTKPSATDHVAFARRKA